jgi:hypothetical protein
MDQATQQNAALVEQMAAAASSLKSQSWDLVETVAIFKLNENGPVMRVNVRSTASSADSFGGHDRRALANPPTNHKPAMAAARLPAAMTSSKSAPVSGASGKPSGDEDKWETS